MTVTCWRCGEKVKVQLKGLTHCPKCGTVVAICNTKTREVIKVK